MAARIDKIVISELAATDLLLGDAHRISGTVTTIIEHMMFELFTEPNLCGLGLG